MIPKKYKDVYKDLSEDLDLKEKYIADCVEFYYINLRSCLTDLEHLNINCPGLGHFYIKSNTVKKDIVRFKKIIENHKTYTLRSYQYHKQIKGLIVKLEEIKKKKEKEDLKKQKFNKKRNAKSKRDMEK